MMKTVKWWQSYDYELFKMVMWHCRAIWQLNNKLYALGISRDPSLICIDQDITAWQQWASCQIRKIADAHVPGMPGKRSRNASRHVRHARTVKHAGVANYWFPLNLAVWKKRSRHPRRMRIPQIYVSGKRPMIQMIGDHGQKWLRFPWLCHVCATWFCESCDLNFA